MKQNDLIPVEGSITIEKKRITRFKNIESEPVTKTFIKDREGSLSIKKNGHFNLEFLFDDGRAFLQTLFERVEIHVTRTKKGKKKSVKSKDSALSEEKIEITPDEYTVTFSYHNFGVAFNGYFEKGEKTQWMLIDGNAEKTSGYFLTKSIKCNMTEKGGTIEIEFKSVVSALWTSICRLSINLKSQLEDKEMLS